MVRFRPVIFLVVALLVSSCAAIQQEIQSSPRPQMNFATAEAAFNILIERHVDKPSSSELLNAAVDAVVTLLVKLNDPSPQMAKPTFTNNPASDFAKFAAALNDVLAANP